MWERSTPGRSTSAHPDPRSSEKKRGASAAGAAGAPFEPPGRALARPYLALAFLAAVLLAGLATPLWFLDYDEAVYAAVSRGMLESGDWIRATWNGRPFYEKPALFYHLTALAYSLLGVTPLAPRLVSALATLAGLTLIAWEMRRRFGKNTSEMAVWLAGAGLLSMLLGRIGLLDALLTAEITLALLSFRRGLDATRAGERLRWLAAGYAASGAALATKGPVFPLLIGGILLLHALMEREVRESLRRSGLVWGIPAFLAVGTPWYLLAYRAEGSKVFEEFIGRHTLGRALAPMQGHSGPLWYYLPVCLAALLPFSALLPNGVAMLRGGQEETRRFARFLITWAGVLFVAISASATKLPGYAAPLLPALAMLAALGLSRPDGEKVGAARHRFRPAAVWHVTLGLGLLVAAGIAASPYLVERAVNGHAEKLLQRVPALACWPPAPWSPGIAACALVLGMGAISSWFLARKGSELWGIRALGAAAAICWTGLWLTLGGLAQASRITPLVSLSREAAAALPEKAPLYLVELNHCVTPNLATGRRLIFMGVGSERDRARLRALLSGSDRARVILPTAWWNGPGSTLGGKVLEEKCGLLLLESAAER